MASDQEGALAASCEQDASQTGCVDPPDYEMWVNAIAISLPITLATLLACLVLCFLQRRRQNEFGKKVDEELSKRSKGRSEPLKLTKPPIQRRPRQTRQVSASLVQNPSSSAQRAVMSDLRHAASPSQPVSSQPAVELVGSPTQLLTGTPPKPGDVHGIDSPNKETSDVQPGAPPLPPIGFSPPSAQVATRSTSPSSTPAPQTMIATSGQSQEGEPVVNEDSLPPQVEQLPPYGDGQPEMRAEDPIQEARQAQEEAQALKSPHASHPQQRSSENQSSSPGEMNFKLPNEGSASAQSAQG